jgi:hypothetical protein
MMKHIKLFESFVTEGSEVTTIDLGEKVQSHVDEIDNAFKVASAELYELKKIADEVKMEWPEVSRQINSIVEPMMESLEGDMTKNIKTLSKIK